MLSRSFFMLGFSMVTLTGCVSARISDREPDHAYYRRDLPKTVEALKIGLEKQGPKGNDRLLYLMDLGVALHESGDFKQSNQFLLEAEEIAEVNDYTSLLAEAGTLLTSENTKYYQGEEYEKVLIHVYLALNFLGLGQEEPALVEAKRMNRVLERMISEGKRPYELSPFGKYLSAVIYESLGEYSDASIDYAQTVKLLPAEKRQLGQDLWLMAHLQKDPELRKKREAEYSVSKTEKDKLLKRNQNEKFGELLVVFENGLGPKKVQDRDYGSIAKFMVRGTATLGAKIFVGGVPVGDTRTYHDVEKTALLNFEARYGGLVAKRLLGVAAKIAAGEVIKGVTHSNELGLAAQIFMLLSDQADLRSWGFLPRQFQLLRVTLPVGKHEVRAQLLGKPDQVILPMAEIRPKKKTWIFFRDLP